MDQPGVTDYLLQWAVAALGVVVTILLAAISLIIKSYSNRQTALEADITVLQGEVVSMDKRLVQVQASALTHPEVKEILEERFLPLREGQKRVEDGLSLLVGVIDKINLKMAVLDDRERRGSNNRQSE